MPTLIFCKGNMTTQPPNGDRQGRSTPSNSNGNVRVPPTVFAQLEALRKSGIVNMFTEVHAGLHHAGFEEAMRWLESNPDQYSEGIKRGFSPTDPDAVEEINPDPLRESVPDEPPTPTRTDASTVTEQSLLDHLQSLRRFSMRAEEFYANGSWRDTASLTDEELDLVDRFDAAADFEPRQCYRNALLTVAYFGESHDVTYVEGYVKTNSPSSPIEHAWVELNEKVVELTFPDGPQTEADAAYLGVEFPVADVKTKVFDERMAESLLY